MPAYNLLDVFLLLLIHTESIISETRIGIFLHNSSMCVDIELTWTLLGKEPEKNWNILSFCKNITSIAIIYIPRMRFELNIKRYDKSLSDDKIGNFYSNIHLSNPRVSGAGHTII